MSDLQVRLPSKSEFAFPCLVCERHPARTLSFTNHEHRSTVLLCALHYEDLVRKVCNSQLTYEERVAHGVSLRRKRNE